MDVPGPIAPLWAAFLASTVRPPATALYEVFHFGDSQVLADSLADLVRRGDKVVVCERFRVVYP